LRANCGGRKNGCTSRGSKVPGPLATPNIQQIDESVLIHLRTVQSVASGITADRNIPASPECSRSFAPSWNRPSRKSTSVALAARWRKVWYKLALRFPRASVLVRILVIVVPTAPLGPALFTIITYTTEPPGDGSRDGTNLLEKNLCHQHRDTESLSSTEHGWDGGSLGRLRANRPKGSPFR
jgi:hypothetical protein